MNVVSNTNSNVVSLDGGPVADLREPREAVIFELERILEMARAGEVQGISLAYVYADGVASYTNAGLFRSYAVIGAVECAKTRLTWEMLS